MFDINSKVVCVDDTFTERDTYVFSKLPKKGNVYTVRDIVPAQDWKLQGTCAIYLHELKNAPTTHIEPGFGVWRFAEVEEESIKQEQEEVAFA